ncbi:MAG: glycoside hydrolase family 5 protein [Kiritimatiellaeota bacterium]|nr:glycoside hydrolase family 5 protein [Kiritimatiellota bacterium]
MSKTKLIRMSALAAMLCLTAQADEVDRLASAGATAPKRLAELKLPEMTGWVRRTHNIGVVEVADGVLKLGTDVAGQDSILQYDIPLAGTGAARLAIAARWRLEGVVGGDQGYQKMGIQGRYKSGGNEIGGWVALGNGAGTTEWADDAIESDVPEGADSFFIRVYAYGCKSGRILVSALTVDGISAEAMAAHKLRFRPAKEYGAPPPASRLEKMKSGININNWFCQPWNWYIDGTRGNFNAEWYDMFMPDADLKKLAASGVRHIRLPIEPEAFMDLQTGALRHEEMALLGKALARIRAAGLAVEFNPHCKMPALKAMCQTKGMPDKFVRWAGEMAEWLNANTDPEWVFIDVLNEPGSAGYYINDWIPMQDRLIAAIRAKAPRHTLILNAAGYQLWNELEWFPVHPDLNTVYAVHYYHPGVLTHQGALWMKTWYHPLRKIPWPFTANDLDAAIANLDRTGKNAEYAAHSEQVLRDQIARGECLPEASDKHFDFLAEWAKTNKRAIVINEFGVNRDHCDVESHARWLRYVREACAKRGFGWSHWEYQANMGFADGKPGERVYDAKLAEALGFVP